MATVPARVTAFINEANVVAPGRRKSSDGTYVDKPGDHNVDYRGVNHAGDLSESMPGTPYWEPRFAQFDVWAHCYSIAAAYIATSDVERKRRWRWLYDGGYMVWFDGTKDIIFNPRVSLSIRQNGAFKTEHFQHAHFSIGHTEAAENDTQPIFGEPEDDDVNDQDKKDIANQAGVVAARAVIAELKGDGTAKNPGLLNEVLDDRFGGYVNGTWTPKALFGGLRKLTNLVK